MEYQTLLKCLISETETYCKNNHISALVLGISGGIDSTIVSVIANQVCKNLGIPFIGRSLPIKNQSDEYEVSLKVGKAFCTDFKSTNLSHLYNETLKFIKGAEGINTDDTKIANGNIQARLRMSYLYNLASINKGLVLSTDNQTEYQLGFWTVHGDVGDFDPIQNLWKTEIYELAKWLIEDYQDKIEQIYSIGNDATEFLIRKEAIEASMALTPTDGLGISNSDIEQLGVNSYAELDEILKGILEIESIKEPILRVPKSYELYKKYGKDKVLIVASRHQKSEFKRQKAPICISREILES